MFKIKKGDTVQVITGADKGKKGKILEIFGASGRALVEGIKLVKKHKRQTRQDQKGGIISTEAPINLSNLMAICKNCNRPVRVGSNTLKDGTKSRVCKKCKEPL